MAMISLIMLVYGYILCAVGKDSLKVCQSTVSARIFELPHKLQCNESTYENIEVKLEKKNIKEYETKAKSLEIVERICSTNRDFWGTRTETKTMNRISVNINFAQELIEQHACINDDGMKRIDNLNVDYDCQYKWMKSINTRTISCYYNYGKVWSTHDGHSRSDIVNFQSCVYKDGFCETVNSKYVTWEVDTRVKSEYVDVGIFQALRAGSKLFIEELGMAFKAPKDDEKVWVDREFKFTKIIKVATGNKKLKAETDPIDALRDEVQSKFAFLMEMMKSPKSKMVYICDVLNKIIGIERTLSSIDPNKYIQQKLGTHLLLAKQAGDFVVTWPCFEVSTFRWVADKRSKCHIGIPVEYKLNDSDIYHFGYVRPGTQIITPNSVEIDCYQKGTEITYVNNKLEIHVPHSGKVVALNTSNYIPLEQTQKEGVGFGINYLDAAWIYNSEELTYADVSAQIIDAINKNDKSKMEARRIEKKRRDFDFLNMFGLFNPNIWAILFAIINMLEKILIIIVVYKLFAKKFIRRWKNRKFHNVPQEITQNRM